MLFVWLLFNSLISTSFAQHQDDPDLKAKTGGEWNHLEETRAYTIDLRFENHTTDQTNNGNNILSTSQAWQAREAMIKSTRFKNEKCITVGFNLQKEDMTFFHSLNSQLIYLESANMPDLGKILYHSWCVR